MLKLFSARCAICHAHGSGPAMLSYTNPEKAALNARPAPLAIVTVCTACLVDRPEAIAQVIEAIPRSTPVVLHVATEPVREVGS